MKFTFFKRFKKLLVSASAAALMSGMLGFAAAPAYANTRTPGAAPHADNTYVTDRDPTTPAADAPAEDPVPAAFRPGQWRRVTENQMGNPNALSLEAVTLAERNASRDAGRPVIFYKVIVREGPNAGVYTNLIDSQWRGADVNRMYMFSRGLLEPVNDTDDLNNWGYRNIRVTDYDRSLARYVADAHGIVVARANTRPDVQLASAETVRPAPVPVRRPAVVARTTTPRVVPVPVPRPVDLGTPAATVVAAAEERPADPAPVAVAAVEERAAPAVVAEQPAPVALAQADAVASPVTGGDVVATPLAQLDIPVRRVRTIRITPDRPVVEQPVAVASAEQPAAAATVQVAAAAPAVTPVPERAVLTASNDAPVRDVFAAFAANDTRSPIQRMLDLRNARLQGELKNTPQPANDDHDRSSKAPFNVAVLNETPRLPGGGAPARGWVTPAGRKMGFHVYENGRFRPAPQLMAA